MMHSPGAGSAVLTSRRALPTGYMSERCLILYSVSDMTAWDAKSTACQVAQRQVSETARCTLSVAP